MGMIGNIDTLYASVKVDNYLVVAGELLKDLQQLKEQRILESNYKPTYVFLGGIEFEFVYGKYSWAYGLKCDDFTLYLARETNRSNYPLYVEFRQEYLWQEGHKGGWERFLEFLGELGFRYETSKVSRADPAVHTDLPVLKYEYLQHLHTDPRCAAPRKLRSVIIDPKKVLLETWEEDGNYYTGLRVGMGQPLMVRMYDKSLEIKKSGKLWFNTIWLEKGLNIEKQITNIEFEIKREWFNRFQIDTVEDLFNKLGTIWRYLTKNYFSFKYYDDERRSRRTICEWWQDMREAAFDYDGSRLAKRAQTELNQHKAVLGAYGYLTSFAAALGHDKIDNRLLSEVLNRINKLESEGIIDIDERIKQKSERKVDPFESIFTYGEIRKALGVKQKNENSISAK